MHIGKTCKETLCRDLYVDEWKLDVVTDTETGRLSQNEHFAGPEKMKRKSEQTYLGDVLSADGRHLKNVLARKSKSLGTINQIMQILQNVFFGKYYFEVAMVLRSSLLLSSLLLNSEAWVNITETEIRKLEKTDEMLLSKILGCEANTSNAFKYLELGVYPVRYEIMKRKILFLHYILQQEKSSMIYKVLQATRDNPTKNDFVKTCESYLSQLKINMTFEELSQMSKWSVKKLVKDKTQEAGFSYLLNEKNKQSKISHIQYSDLALQDYMLEGNRNTEMSKLIYKARGLCLNLKTHKKWKYKDDICIGCQQETETGDELLFCDGYGKGGSEEDITNMSYNMFFSGMSSDMHLLAKVISRRLKIREKMLEGIT